MLEQPDTSNATIIRAMSPNLITGGFNTILLLFS